MIEKLTLTKFITSILIAFSISILGISFFIFFWGDSAYGLSSMFQMGSKGIALPTLMQVLFCETLLVCSRGILFSKILFKHMRILWRTIFMLISFLLVTVACSVLFGWFPIQYPSAWISFFVSAFICVTMASLVMIYKTRKESVKYEKLLEQYKEEHKKGE